jgi:hypothetical protein
MLPKKRQNLLFSATFSDEIRSLANSLLDATRCSSRSRGAIRRPSWSTAGRAPGRPRAQARAAVAPHARRRLAPGAGVHPHQARRQPAGLAARATTASAPPRSTATRARARAPRRLADFKAGSYPRAGGDGSRGPRTGHRPAAARGEFRAAARAGGLRPPHRPHRPRRRRGRGRFAGVRRRASVAVRTSSGCSAGKFPSRDGTGLRAGSVGHPRRADRDRAPRRAPPKQAVAAAAGRSGMGSARGPRPENRRICP